MYSRLTWILMVLIYGVLAVAGERRGDEFPPNSFGDNFPQDDDESNGYSGIDEFFGSKSQHNSYLPSQKSDESFIPDIEIFLPDVYNDKSDDPRSNNDLGESKPYDNWRPLNLKSGSSKPNETLDSMGIDKSYINSILGDYYGIHPGSTDYGEYEDYDYETTTAEPEVVTTTIRSEKKTETPHVLPKEPASTPQETSKTTGADEDFNVFLPSSTILVSLPPQEEPTPPPLAPTQRIRSSSTIKSTISTTSTSTNQLELTTVPTTTTTLTTTTKPTLQNSLASTTTTASKPVTTVRTTSRNTKAASTITTIKTTSGHTTASSTSTIVPSSTSTPHSVKSTQSTPVSNKAAFKTEPVEGTTGEEKLTGHSRGSTGEEMVPDKDTTTSLSEVLPKKVEFSTVVLIISLISVVIVLVFVLVVVIVVRARLHRQGKYNIPPDSDAKSGVAESSSKTKFVNEMDSGSVVVPVQYNNSMA